MSNPQTVTESKDNLTSQAGQGSRRPEELQTNITPMPYIQINGTYDPQSN